MYLSSLTDRISGRGADGWAVSDRAADMIARGEDIITLTIGDPDFETPFIIAEAAIAAIRNGRTHYAPIWGVPKLREVIASTQSRRDGVEWRKENVIIFPGAQNALFSAMMCIGEAGKKVIVFDPMYATYSAVVGASGAEKVTVPLKLSFGLSGQPEIDFDALELALDRDVVAILLNAPNNPAGLVFDQASLERLSRLCIEHDLWVISDEVYRDLIFDGSFPSVSAIDGMASRTVILNSLSKSHAMTGWRLGWAIAPVSLTEHLARVAQCSLFGSPTFIQDAAIVALEQGGEYVEEHCAILRRRRDILLKALERSQFLQVLRPAGGMFVLANVSRTGLSGKEFAERALDEARVAVVPGMAFSPTDDYFVRISFAGDEGRLEEGAQRLVDFTQRFGQDWAK